MQPGTYSTDIFSMEFFYGILHKARQLWLTEAQHDIASLDSKRVMQFVSNAYIYNSDARYRHSRSRNDFGNNTRASVANFRSYGRHCASGLSLNIGLHSIEIDVASNLFNLY